jgi:hypothetical protein
MRHIGATQAFSASLPCSGFFNLLQVSNATRLAALSNAGCHLGNDGIQGHKKLRGLKNGL